MISSVFQRNHVLFPLPGQGDCPKMLQKPITLRPFCYGEELSQRQNSEHLVSEFVLPTRCHSRWIHPKTADWDLSCPIKSEWQVFVQLQFSNSLPTTVKTQDVHCAAFHLAVMPLSCASTPLSFTVVCLWLSIPLMALNEWSPSWATDVYALSCPSTTDFTVFQVEPILSQIWHQLVLFNSLSLWRSSSEEHLL